MECQSAWTKVVENYFFESRFLLIYLVFIDNNNNSFISTEKKKPISEVRQGRRWY